MRIAVIGAGAIGCMLGAKLTARGHQIVLVGRPEQVEAITRQGLTVTEPGGAERRVWLPAATRMDEQPELVLLTVKSQDVTAACREIAPFVRHVPVVTLQNGVRADELAAAVLGREFVVGGVVMAAVDYLRPGHVTVLFPGWLIVGEPFDPMPGRARAIADVLGDALPTYVTTNMFGTRWSKLISNLNNALCAATDLPLPEIAHTRAGRTASAQLMREGARVARAAGIHLDHGLYGLSWQGLRHSRDTALIAPLQALMSSVLLRLPEGGAQAVVGAAGRSRLGRIPLRGSTWQSIARSKPSEIDYLNGEVVKLGQQYGVPTPYNKRVVALVREVEQTHQFASLDALNPSSAREDAPFKTAAGMR
jgi:2-dehydropantoate 2-reductase